MRRFVDRIICTIGLLALLHPVISRAADVRTEPFVDPLFSNDMVLQRDVPDPVWGWAQPGTAVTVAVNGSSATATAGADGKWMAKIGPFPAGGPFELSISAGAQQVKLTNILVGDVWICSGQSNMEFGVGNAINAKDEIAQADHPQIRLFTVPKKPSDSPEILFNQPTPKWLICTPENVSNGGWGGFTAVGYFFGRDLQKELNVPIGLIHTSWGGTICEAWTSEQALNAKMPDFRGQVEQVVQNREAEAAAAADPRQHLEEWYQKHDPGSAAHWDKKDAADADWQTTNLPGAWQQAKVGLDNFNGIVWYRRSIPIPPDWVGKKLMLHLGIVDDRDTTYINGVRVGGEDDWLKTRDYPIPAEANNDANLQIAIRVLDTGGLGGLYGHPEMRIECPGSSTPPISLTGQWKFKPGPELKTLGTIPGSGGDNPNVVTVLYNGMVNPLVPFAIKGAIWYQGESNADRAMQYRRLLPTMIGDWRSRFGVGDFPFFIVQLANFKGAVPQPGESSWAELREAQVIAAQTAGHSEIASAIDIGDAGDIHPKNKQEVGRRLALDALATVYGKDVEYAGPTFQSMTKQDHAAVIHFTHAKGLTAKGGDLKGFAIAGADGHFVWADAKIDGDSVVVSSPQVPDPAVVRYNWADNPDGNLYNDAGLPATSFRTDSPKTEEPH